MSKVALNHPAEEYLCFMVLPESCHVGEESLKPWYCRARNRHELLCCWSRQRQHTLPYGGQGRRKSLLFSASCL